MTFDEWKPKYKRLTGTYGKAISADQCDAYYEALKAFPAFVVDNALTRAIKAEKFLPSAAEIREHAMGVMASVTAPPTMCDLCHGNTWVDAEPIVQWGITYRDVVRRCPQCVPQSVGVRA